MNLKFTQEGPGILIQKGRVKVKVKALLARVLIVIILAIL